MQNQTVNFRELLKQNSFTVDRPRSAPDCWLIGTLGNWAHETLKTGADKITFDLLEIEGHPGNDEGILEGVNLKNLRSPYAKNLTATYWASAAYHLTNMLDRVIGDPERPMEERLPETKGLRVMFKVRRLEEDGKDTGQNEVDARTVALAANPETETETEQEAAE